MVEARILISSPETSSYGLLGCSVLVAVEGRLVRPVSVPAGEAACRVAVARGDVPGYSWAPTLPTGV